MIALIRWIAIYPVDSAFYVSNNRGQEASSVLEQVVSTHYKMRCSVTGLIFVLFILDEGMSDPDNESSPLPSQVSDHAWTLSLQETSLEDLPVHSDVEQVLDPGVDETT